MGSAKKYGFGHLIITFIIIVIFILEQVSFEIRAAFAITTPVDSAGGNSPIIEVTQKNFSTEATKIQPWLDNSQLEGDIFYKFFNNAQVYENNFMEQMDKLGSSWRSQFISLIDIEGKDSVFISDPINKLLPDNVAEIKKTIELCYLDFVHNQTGSSNDFFSNLSDICTQIDGCEFVTKGFSHKVQVNGYTFSISLGPTELDLRVFCPNETFARYEKKIRYDYKSSTKKEYYRFITAVDENGAVQSTKGFLVNTYFNSSEHKWGSEVFTTTGISLDDANADKIWEIEGDLNNPASINVIDPNLGDFSPTQDSILDFYFVGRNAPVLTNFFSDLNSNNILTTILGSGTGLNNWTLLNEALGGNNVAGVISSQLSSIATALVNQNTISNTQSTILNYQLAGVILGLSSRSNNVFNEYQKTKVLSPGGIQSEKMNAQSQPYKVAFLGNTTITYSWQILSDGTLQEDWTLKDSADPSFEKTLLKRNVNVSLGEEKYVVSTRYSMFPDEPDMHSETDVVKTYSKQGDSDVVKIDVNSNTGKKSGTYRIENQNGGYKITDISSQTPNIDIEITDSDNYKMVLQIEKPDNSGLSRYEISSHKNNSGQGIFTVTKDGENIYKEENNYSIAYVGGPEGKVQSSWSTEKTTDSSLLSDEAKKSLFGSSDVEGTINTRIGISDYNIFENGEHSSFTDLYKQLTELLYLDNQGVPNYLSDILPWSIFASNYSVLTNSGINSDLLQSIKDAVISSDLESKSANDGTVLDSSNSWEIKDGVLKRYVLNTNNLSGEGQHTALYMDFNYSDGLNQKLCDSIDITFVHDGKTEKFTLEFGYTQPIDDPSHPETISAIIYKDSNGNVLYNYQSGKDYYEEHEYDASGIEIKGVSYRKNGTSETMEAWQNDSSGFRIEYAYMHQDGDNMDTVKWTKDSEGNITSWAERHETADNITAFSVGQDAVTLSGSPIAKGQWILQKAESEKRDGKIVPTSMQIFKLNSRQGNSLDELDKEELYREQLWQEEGDLLLYDCIIGDTSAEAPFKIIKKMSIKQIPDLYASITTGQLVGNYKVTQDDIALYIKSADSPTGYKEFFSFKDMIGENEMSLEDVTSSLVALFSDSSKANEQGQRGPFFSVESKSGFESSYQDLLNNIDSDKDGEATLLEAIMYLGNKKIECLKNELTEQGIDLEEMKKVLIDDYSQYYMRTSGYCPSPIEMGNAGYYSGLKKYIDAYQGDNFSSDEVAVLQQVADYLVEKAKISDIINQGITTISPADFLSYLQECFNNGDVEWLTSYVDKLLALGLAYYYGDQKVFNPSHVIDPPANWVLNLGNGYNVQMSQGIASEGEKAAFVTSAPRAISASATKGMFMIYAGNQAESTYYPFEVDTTKASFYRMGYGDLNKLIYSSEFKEVYQKLDTGGVNYEAFVDEFHTMHVLTSFVRTFIKSAGHGIESVDTTRFLAAKVLSELLDNHKEELIGNPDWNKDMLRNAIALTYEIEGYMSPDTASANFMRRMQDYGLLTDKDTIYLPYHENTDVFGTVVDSAFTALFLYQLYSVAQKAPHLLSKLSDQIGNLSATSWNGILDGVKNRFSSALGAIRGGGDDAAKLIAYRGPTAQELAKLPWFVSHDPRLSTVLKSFISGKNVSDLISTMQRYGIFLGAFNAIKPGSLNERWQNFKYGYTLGSTTGVIIYGLSGATSSIFAKATRAMFGESGTFIPQGITSFLTPMGSTGYNIQVALYRLLGRFAPFVDNMALLFGGVMPAYTYGISPAISAFTERGLISEGTANTLRIACGVGVAAFISAGMVPDPPITSIEQPEGLDMVSITGRSGTQYWVDLKTGEVSSLVVPDHNVNIIIDNHSVSANINAEQLRTLDRALQRSSMGSVSRGTTPVDSTNGLYGLAARYAAENPSLNLHPCKILIDGKIVTVGSLNPEQYGVLQNALNEIGLWSRISAPTTYAYSMLGALGKMPAGQRYIDFMNDNRPFSWMHPEYREAFLKISNFIAKLLE